MLNKGHSLAHKQELGEAKRHKTRRPFITQNRKLLTKSETVLVFNTLDPPDGVPISSTLSPSILDTKARQAGRQDSGPILQLILRAPTYHHALSWQ